MSSERASAHARIPFQSATCSDGDGAGDVSASKTERKMAFGSLPSRLTGMYYSSIAFAQKARHTVRTRTHALTQVYAAAAAVRSMPHPTYRGERALEQRAVHLEQRLPRQQQHRHLDRATPHSVAKWEQREQSSSNQAAMVMVVGRTAVRTTGRARCRSTRGRTGCSRRRRRRRCSRGLPAPR